VTPEDIVPTYQYACTEPECGHAFEQVQSFSDDALTVCPQCEGRLRKVFNAVGVVFKGSGFYRTDSRTDSRAGGASAEGSGSSTGETSTTSDSTGEAGGGSSSSTSAPAASSPAKPTTSTSPAGAGAA
jgi:putative FmdB family regulatory protein